MTAPTDAQQLISAAVAGKRIVIGQWEQAMRDRGTAEDEIAVISGWDRAVVALVASIAERHVNTPNADAANPRGYCPACGGYRGEHCPDLAGVLVVCAAWDAVMANDTVRIGLSDEWPEGVVEP